MATGKSLKMARVRADLTQRQVAKQMGLSRQTLYAIERAATVDPDREAEYRAALSALVSKGVSE